MATKTVPKTKQKPNFNKITKREIVNQLESFGMDVPKNGKTTKAELLEQAEVLGYLPTLEEFYKPNKTKIENPEEAEKSVEPKESPEIQPEESRPDEKTPESKPHDDSETGEEPGENSPDEQQPEITPEDEPEKAPTKPEEAEKPKKDKKKGKGTPEEEKTAQTSKKEFDEIQKKIKGFKQTQEAKASKQTEDKGLFTVTDRPQEKRKRGRPPKQKASPSLLDGYILLMVLDMALPAGISVINNLIRPENRVKSSELVLDEEQFNKLEPMADRAAEHLQVNVNPLTAFLVVGSLMYVNNFIQAQAVK